MIVLTCPKTGAPVGVHPSHIASVAEGSAEVLAAIEAATQKKGGDIK